MERSNLSPKIGKICDGFVTGLKAIYGEKLISVILYGSAASGEYSETNPNLNMAVVLDEAGLADVSRSARLVNRYKYRIIKPVFFTEKYITSSADVFPIEFIDMKENNIVLHGKDLLKDVSIDEKNLRFQCEQELKSRLINIKTAYIGLRSASDKRRLLFTFASSVLHLLRNVLRLKGRSLPYSKDDVAKAAAREFGIGHDTFARILDARKGMVKLEPDDIDGLFVDIVKDLEKITEAIDRI